MNKKKLLIITIVVAAVLVCGGIFAGSKSKDDPDKIAEHNKQVLENADKEEKLDKGVISSKDATYEEWLSAAAVTAVSLTYPDFQLEGIYTDSESDLNDHKNSKGVYLKFTAAGSDYTICAKPLDEERTEKGTIDLYEEKLGFATFDAVKSSDIPKDAKELPMKSLEKLIGKCSLVSLYEHY